MNGTTGIAGTLYAINPSLMEDFNLKETLSTIRKLDSIIKLNKIVFAYRLKYTDLVQSVNTNFWLYNDDFYVNNYINPMLDDINSLIKGKEKSIIEAFNFNNNDIDPWLATRFEAENNKDSNIAIYLYLQTLSEGFKVFDLNELDINSSNSNDKYGLTKISLPLIADNRGIRINNDIFFYHPYFDVLVSDNKSPNLFQKISNIDNTKVDNLSIRLLDSYSVPVKEYRSVHYEFSEKYYGPNYDIEEICFREIVGTTVHIDTKTGNKIFVRLSIVDEEKWIEIEELPKVTRNINKVKTKSIHSIFDIYTNKLIHIDGHVNYYDKDIYSEMYNTIRMKKTPNHIKMWLLEGNLEVRDWCNLCIAYLKNNELLNEIFNGRIEDKVING